MHVRNALLLAFALLIVPAFAALEVHDTLVAGLPWLSVESIATKARKGAKPDPSSLRIDKDRGLPRARLKLPDGSLWTFWDRIPFARTARGGIVSTGLAARIVGSTLVLPRDATPGARLRRSIPVPVATASKPVADPATPAHSDPPPSAATESTSTTALPVADTAPATHPSPRRDTAIPAPTPDSQPRPTTPHSSDASDIAGDDGIFTVVLDAGHGGKDPGAVGKKIAGKAVQEKDATLGIVLKMRDELRAYKGIRVILTRDGDEFLSLGERTRKANAAKGDLFVSIHCNSLPLNSTRRDEVQGFMVYLLREAKSDADRAIERRENEVIRFETGERQRKESLSPVEWVMLEHQLNLYTKESERFAGLVVRNLESSAPVRKERTGAGQAGFFVLVGALMPSVLIETGYVSNDADAATLGSDAGRKTIAKQIARAIDSFRRARH